MRNQFESLESRRLLNAGDLDPTFGAGGAVGYRAATDESIGIVRELPDGKLLIGASRGGLLELLRLNADGSLDSSFGSAGKIATHYPSEGTVTVSPTGKLLATIGANNDIGLFHADGSLIKTITDSKWQGELSMGFTPDDELLAAAATSDQHVLVERFTSSGQLDTSFASAGKATINEHELQELRVNPTGTALVVASTTSSFYDPDIGEVEYSYTTNVYAIDTAGQVNEPVGFAAGTESPAPPVGPLRRRADGDWAVAYESEWDLSNYWHLTRIGFDGSAKLVDTLLSTSPANVYNVVDIGAEPTDREVVISNYSQDDPRTPWFITRYFPDGSVDPSYGNGGQMALDILPNVRGAATVDHNGNVIIAASQMRGDQNKLVFVRVQGGVGHPTSFNLDANGTLNITATPGPDIIDIGLRHLRHGQDVRVVVRQGDEAHSFEASKVKRLNILAGDGNDNINNTTDLPCYIDGGHGNNILNGGQGNDTLIGGKNDDLLFGNGGNDQLFGNNGNDKLLGGAGNDYLLGGAGNDRLFGEDGRDTLSGAGGNDRLFGGSSADRLTGGMGSDSSENDPLDNRAGDIETLLA